MKITVSLKRSAIGITPDQHKNLIGLGLMRRGRHVLLDDTSSIRGMIRKVIHLVQVQKGDQIPVTKAVKKPFEVIPGSGESAKTAKAAKKAPVKTEAKAVKKIAKKSATK